MFDRLDDTIAAISSPPGIGTRGIVRLSGNRALKLAATLFESDGNDDIATSPGHRRHFGRLRLDRDVTLPAEAYVFRMPASYTRQDIVEIHTLGSPPVLAMLIDRLIGAGARVAEPGEFTARAFLSGSIDLTQVEGVAAMIHAQTDAQLRASEQLLHGHLGRRTLTLRETLADLLALIEAGIDFAEEPIEFVTPEQVRQTLEHAAGELASLLRESASFERLKTVPRVVLAGPPNAGKSTLFNRLTGVDRAISTATAGTTRDLLTAPLRLAASEVMLCDTAGLDDRDPRDMGEASDETAGETLRYRIEQATHRAMAEADLVLIVLDIACDATAPCEYFKRHARGRPTIVVLNKADRLEGGEALADTLRCDDGVPTVSLSARTGRNINRLRSCIAEILFLDTDRAGAAGMSLSARQRANLSEALDALERGRRLLRDRNAVDELLALEVRHAIHALSLMTGQMTTEDLLGRVFSRFCIGK